MSNFVTTRIDRMGWRGFGRRRRGRSMARQHSVQEQGRMPDNGAVMNGPYDLSASQNNNTERPRLLKSKQKKTSPATAMPPSSQHARNAMSLRTLGDVVRRSAPLISVTPNHSLVQVAHVLHDERVDAVAVLSDDDEFLGLVTSRDVASCIARGDILADVTATMIMTAAPITLAAHESPARALAIMRSGRFRHIPVLEEQDGKLIGIVDVLHLAYDAITRLQASYAMIPSRRTFDFMRAARANIEKPTLRPIVEAAPLVTLSRSNTVATACEAIAEHHLAAVVVVDEHGILDGIFTCRDVSTRVVAKERDPNTVTLEQVMTPNPDSASPDFTILESLQRMQACSYRHLPVVEDHSRKVVGLVNVLQLASDALLETTTTVPSSRMSFSSPPASPGTAGATLLRRSSQYHSSAASNSSSGGGGGGGGFGSFFASLFSSASYAPPSPQRRSLRKGLSTGARQMEAKRQFSNLSRREIFLNNQAATFVSFKFRDINDEYRKVRVSANPGPGAFNQLVIDVRRRFLGSSRDTGAIKLKYMDEDDDAVLIGNDEDLASCLEDARRLKGKAVHLRVSLVSHRSGRGDSSAGVSSPLSSHENSLRSSPQGSTVTPKVSPPSEASTAVSPDTSSISSGPRIPPLPPLAPTPSVLKAQEAHASMMNGNIEKAISLFDEALELDSGNARAMGGRGAARLIGGNSTGAEEDYRAAVELLDAAGGNVAGDVTFEMCISGLVEALIDQRRYEEAVVVASREDAKGAKQRCIDAFGDELESSVEAARQALESSEFGESMSIYSNSLRVESAYLSLATDQKQRADLRIGRAKCYRKLEDYDMALEDYEAAAVIEPESVAAHKGCAACLAEMEQPARALESYERALKLDSGDEDVAREIKLLKSLLPDPLKEKKDEIAKLGALLGNMKFGAKK